jgi:Cu+-exporting ATPase
MDAAPDQSGRADAGAGRSARVEMTLAGMHCRSCALLIEDTLIEQPGVQMATVDLDSAHASVEYDPRAVTPAELCAAVVDAGYQASPVNSD